MELKERFDMVEEEFLKFDRVANKLNHRPDLCAFLLLDTLIPETKDIIACSEHDEIYLETDVEKLNELISDEDILTLVRCGVRCGSEGLTMYT
jgi:hypothetical protein